VTNIKVRPNGPLLIEGDDVMVVDANGNEFPIAKRPFALCRCGASSNKPFCDATHRQIGFSAGEMAVTGSGDKPAL
jgi:CDGSH-type Zn-finger protein